MFSFFKKRRQVCVAGFTIIEMIVAIGLFGVVMVIASGALLTMLDANRKAQTIKSVINNLSFALESMTREIRMGSNYHCGTVAVFNSAPSLSDCPNFDDAMAFVNNKTEVVEYSLSGSQIMKKTALGEVAVTAPEVAISRLYFLVAGAEQGADTEQPSALIIMEGCVMKKDIDKSCFNIQTLVSQRLPDLKN